ncbi:hypothetical protein BJX76DRAFT_360638 [Aspergillus varians]
MSAKCNQTSFFTMCSPCKDLAAACIGRSPSEYIPVDSLLPPPTTTPTIIDLETSPDFDILKCGDTIGLSIRRALDPWISGTKNEVMRFHMYIRTCHELVPPGRGRNDNRKYPKNARPHTPVRISILIDFPPWVASDDPHTFDTVLRSLPSRVVDEERGVDVRFGNEWRARRSRTCSYRLQWFADLVALRSAPFMVWSNLSIFGRKYFEVEGDVNRFVYRPR